jgi:hypothetical protein
MSTFPASGLRESPMPTTSPRMITREQWRHFMDSPIVEWGLFVLGIILLLLALVVGPIPGPGGILFAGAGLALILKTSMWAKRHYVRVKRWQPKAGRWMDWALRRPSAQRREALHKAEQPGPGN